MSKNFTTLKWKWGQFFSGSELIFSSIKIPPKYFVLKSLYCGSNPSLKDVFYAKIGYPRVPDKCFFYVLSAVKGEFATRILYKR